MGQKELSGPEAAQGQAHRRRARLGDAPCNYTVALLGTYGHGGHGTSAWVQVGSDVSGRAAALHDEPRRRHAADGAELLPARGGRATRTLANLAERDVYAATVCTCSAGQRSTASPEAARGRSSRRTPRPSSASTTTRRSRSKATSRYDKQPEADVARIYDHLPEGQHLRPRALRAAPSRRVRLSTQQVDPAASPRHLKALRLPARSSTTASVARLVKEGFFEQLFGAGRQGRGAAQGEDRVLRACHRAHGGAMKLDIERLTKRYRVERDEPGGARALRRVAVGAPRASSWPSSGPSGCRQDRRCSTSWPGCCRSIREVVSHRRPAMWRAPASTAPSRSSTRSLLPWRTVAGERPLRDGSCRSVSVDRSRCGDATERFIALVGLDRLRATLPVGAVRRHAAAR